jgi:hypothetical protein
VLIDFDWQDADLLPELLRMPGVSVRLVAGAADTEGGLRIAELCGLPRSTELADLTREIFDVALLSERSGRRDQVERLLRALGTPVESPEPFVRNGETSERRGTGEGVGTADEIPALHHNGHGAWSALEAVVTNGVHGLVGAPADDDPTTLPDPDDTLGLERALAGWTHDTQATAAALYRVTPEGIVRVCRNGPEDGLLESLAQLAARVDMPHVLTREDGPQRGRLWGAWPFRTEDHRAVIAVAAADGTRGRKVWEDAVQSLCAAWSVSEHFSLGDAPRVNLLPPEAFTHRLDMALDRHRHDGFRFALHRLTFAAHEAAIDELVRVLPDRLRGTDCLCRPTPHELLLLCAGSTRAFAHVRSRIQALWKTAWAETGGQGMRPRSMTTGSSSTATAA